MIKLSFLFLSNRRVRLFWSIDTVSVKVNYIIKLEPTAMSCDLLPQCHKHLPLLLFYLNCQTNYISLCSRCLCCHASGLLPGDSSPPRPPPAASYRGSQRPLSLLMSLSLYS